MGNEAHGTWTLAWQTNDERFYKQFWAGIPCIVTAWTVFCVVIELEIRIPTSGGGVFARNRLKTGTPFVQCCKTTDLINLVIFREQSVYSLLVHRCNVDSFLKTSIPSFLTLTLNLLAMQMGVLFPTFFPTSLRFCIHDRLWEGGEFIGEKPENRKAKRLEIRFE